MMMGPAPMIIMDWMSSLLGMGVLDHCYGEMAQSRAPKLSCVIVNIATDARGHSSVCDSRLIAAKVNIRLTVGLVGG